MKKRIVVFLASLMCISLCACGGTESTGGDNATTQTEESGFTPNQPTEKEEIVEEVTLDIDEENLGQYYDTTQYVGTAYLVKGYVWNSDKEENVTTIKIEGYGVVLDEETGEFLREVNEGGFLEIAYTEELMEHKYYYTIITDNNTHERFQDDQIAYVFTTPIDK